MRTTLVIDDDVLAVARSIASERRISLGAAVSELARRGWKRRSADEHRAVPGFAVGPDSGPITPEMVRAASEEW